jgi:hypothetical protein
VTGFKFTVSESLGDPSRIDLTSGDTFVSVRMGLADLMRPSTEQAEKFFEAVRYLVLTVASR